MAMRRERIVWAPDVRCDLTQRYLAHAPWFECHLDEESSRWLREQGAESPIAWLKLDDKNYPDGWRAVPVAAVERE
jgi:hypothetical protein